MPDKNTPGLNKKYIIGVCILTFALPVVCSLVERLKNGDTLPLVALLGKWFIFFSVGVRLFMAGIKQITDPAFTAKEIFHINSPESLPIVRELGFANLCFGLIGIISLFIPAWRIVSAFGSGLYYGIAGFQHLIKKPAGANEKFAMITDIVIFVCLAVYFIKIFSF